MIKLSTTENKGFTFTETERIELFVDWPKWEKIKISAVIKDGKICVAVFYDNELKKEWCMDLPTACVNIDKENIASIAGCNVYFRWVEACVSPTKYIKGQVWAETTILRQNVKTKLGSFHIEF